MSAVHNAQWERVDHCLELTRTLLGREDVDVNAGSVGPDGTKRTALGVALKTHRRWLDCREACEGQARRREARGRGVAAAMLRETGERLTPARLLASQGSTCECGPSAGAELVSLLVTRGAASSAEDAEQVLSQPCHL